MQTLLTNFCFSNDKAGLLLIDMPTGTGKTYNVIDFIYKNYQKVKNKIIFITNLKKNLPVSELKALFDKNDKLEQFEKDVLFLDNNVDTLIDNFDLIENSIPTNYFSNNSVLSGVKRCVNIINTLSKILKEKNNDGQEYGTQENIYFIINQAREDLRDKYEKEFRKAIEDSLKFDENGNKRTKADKINLIKNNPNYQWIGKLYPAVDTDNKKIIFMSIDKFLVRNSTIIEPSYNFIDNKALLNESIIFIDEFDTSKDVLLKSVIKESLDAKINIVELFRIICAGVENTSFTKLLIELSKELEYKIENKEKKYYKPEEIISEFKSRCSEIKSKYNLIDYHKLVETEKENANFLFQDYKFHTILDDTKSIIYMDNDKNYHLNWIKKADKMNINEEQNLFCMLQDIKSFLNYFQNGIKFIAENYRNLKKQRNQEINNFTYESSIKTVLSEFGIEGKYLNYLTLQIMNAIKNVSYQIVDLKSELDFSVYEKGFRFYNFVDSDAFDTQSKINLLSFNLSPEKIIIYLCKSAKVVGISATATLDTVTGNYDMQYIQSKLGQLYYKKSDTEKQRIDSFISNKLGCYDNININVNKCEITDKNYLDCLQTIFDKETCGKIIKEISKYSKDDFVKARYCKVAYAIAVFFKNDIKSFLFLTNISLNVNLDFNSKCINNIFNCINPIGEKGCWHTLDGSVEKFERTKQIINQKLKSGKKVFVISTYQTLGAGQNLQYEFNPKYENDLKTINDNNYNNDKKDFQAIFLDKPTNMFVNMNTNQNEEQLLKFIYQVKCLEEKGQFNLEQATIEIKKAIKIFYHASANKIATPRSKHIYMHTAKIIMQAIGRICRTNIKNKNIYIFYDCQMENDLANCKSELLNRRLNYEFKYLLNNCRNIKQIGDLSKLNINNAKIKKNNDKIESLLKFKYKSDIDKWEELREVVLKHPFDNVGIHNEYDIYCQLMKPSKYYYYNKDKESNCNITYDDYNEYSVSEDKANLKVLMEIPHIKEFFEEKGYATSFEKSNYILLPNVFGRIYLGALGEVVGKFIVDDFLKSFNMKLNRISSLEKYEKFDFVFDNDKYVDFKYWTGHFDKERTKWLEQCEKKLNKCEGKYAYIINILKPENYAPQIYISENSRIIIIPYLYDSSTKQINVEGLINLINN